MSVLEQSVKLKETLDGAYDEVDDTEAVDRRFWAGYRLIVWHIRRTCKNREPDGIVPSKIKLK